MKRIVSGLWGGIIAMAFIQALDQPSVLGSLVPVQLHCEYARNPLGVDVANPRLFWKLESTTRGQRQTAYQILVSTEADLLAKNKGDLWDSGKVVSDETIQIPYSGQPLKSSQQVFWKVRVWDKDGKTSAWSPPAFWIMGLLKPEDWQARWIAAQTNHPTLMLRR
jgi:alpha-L-rhamnosidase